jgi:apolipoprotein D and lipocalin family protein
VSGRRALLAGAAALLLTGCGIMGKHPPMEPVDQVDLDRFMGTWYVVAAIPTFLEDEAYNAVEHYERREPMVVDTTFTFRKGGFDGPRRTFHPTGFVREGTGNAVWGMQFIWPIKADYRVIYLDEAYGLTVIGRRQRDYAWVMSRDPHIAPETHERMRAFLVERGYDVSGLRKVPQQWEDRPAFDPEALD